MHSSGEFIIFSSRKADFNFLFDFLLFWDCTTMAFFPSFSPFQTLCYMPPQTLLPLYGLFSSLNAIAHICTHTLYIYIFINIICSVCTILLGYEFLELTIWYWTKCSLDKRTNDQWITQELWRSVECGYLTVFCSPWIYLQFFLNFHFFVLIPLYFVKLY